MQIFLKIMIIFFYDYLRYEITLIEILKEMPYKNVKFDIMEYPIAKKKYGITMWYNC